MAVDTLSAPIAPPSAITKAYRWVSRLPVSTIVGSVILLFVVFGVLFAPWLAPFDPMALGTPFQTMSWLHPMGTDDLGRDVWARVLYGGRVSLIVGLFAAAIAVGLGLFVGLVAGFSGGMVDEVLMRITEMFQIVPRLLITIVVVTMIGGSVTNVIFVIGILAWPPTARIIRAQVMVVRQEEFISAAILSGASYWRLVLRHTLPNVLPFLLVSASMQVASAILSEAALSFLGLGDPSFPSWGQMLQQSQGFLRQAWWMSLFPGLALALTILALNLVGDGASSKLPGAHR